MLLLGLIWLLLAMMVTVAAHEQCGPQFMRMHALWLKLCMVYAGCVVANDESTNSYTIRGMHGTEHQGIDSLDNKTRH